jgi:hypothetical protein
MRLPLSRLLLLLAALAALGVAAAAARLAERVRPGTGPAAFVLAGWHPILVIESAGTGHHDAVVVLPALLGLLLLARGAPRTAAVLVGVSALVKPVTLPLLALVALDRLRLRPWRRAIGAVAGDALAVAALAAVVSAPYWAGGELARSILAEPGRLVSHPFYALPAGAIGERWGSDARATFGDAARTVSQAATVGIVGLVLVRYAFGAWRRAACPVLVGQLRAWAAVTVALALVPTNAHAWYAVWSLAPVAALTGGRGRLVAPYLLVLALFAVAYHTDVSGR